MNKHKLLLILCCVLSHWGCAQDSLFSNVPSSEQWLKLANGLDYCELDGPYQSRIGNSKVSFLKINPNVVDLKLLAASQLETSAQTVTQWADSFNLNVVINAGMYDNVSRLMNHAYMKVGDHINNPNLKPMNNAVIVLDPIRGSQPQMDIYDLNCRTWEDIHSNYSSCIQGMRMIDCNGVPISWSKNQQPCSMLICAKDSKNMIYFIFCESYYTQNEMLHYLAELPFKLKSAIYMEGGPETSFFVRVGDYTIKKAGNYVSKTVPKKTNNHFWPLPNVIGVRVRQ